MCHFDAVVVIATISCFDNFPSLERAYDTAMDSDCLTINLNQCLLTVLHGITPRDDDAIDIGMSVNQKRVAIDGTTTS